MQGGDFRAGADQDGSVYLERTTAKGTRTFEFTPVQARALAIDILIAAELAEGRAAPKFFEETE